MTLGGKQLALTNLDKVLYPQAGFTKAQVIDYYRRIAPYLLPHLQGKCLTLKRYPEGVDEEFFYEKRCPPYHPDWIATKVVPGEEKPIPYCVVNDEPSLIWIANLASIELHTLLHTVQDITRPVVMVFDLDPGPPATILDCAEIALEMRKVLQRVGLESFPKTSGGKGLHFYVPLNTPVTFDETKNFSRAVAQSMEKRFPEKVVSKMAKALRGGKVFVDWSQNDEHKTTVCVYSLRAKDRPTVSAPLTWAEVKKAISRKDPGVLDIDYARAIERAKKRGDLFKEVLTLEQKLPELGATRQIIGA